MKKSIYDIFPPGSIGADAIKFLDVTDDELSKMSPESAEFIRLQKNTAQMVIDDYKRQGVEVEVPKLARATTTSNLASDTSPARSTVTASLASTYRPPTASSPTRNTTMNTPTARPAVGGDTGLPTLDMNKVKEWRDQQIASGADQKKVDIFINMKLGQYQKKKQELEDYRSKKMIDKEFEDGGVSLPSEPTGLLTTPPSSITTPQPTLPPIGQDSISTEGESRKSAIKKAMLTETDPDKMKAFAQGLKDLEVAYPPEKKDALTEAQQAKKDTLKLAMEAWDILSTKDVKTGLVAGPVETLKGKFGAADQDTLDFQNKLAQIKATIAKARAGTSFTPNEEALLNKYTPTESDSLQMLTTKLKGLVGLFGTTKDAESLSPIVSKEKGLPSVPQELTQGRGIGTIEQNTQTLLDTAKELKEAIQSGDQKRIRQAVINSKAASMMPKPAAMSGATKTLAEVQKFGAESEFLPLLNSIVTRTLLPIPGVGTALGAAIGESEKQLLKGGGKGAFLPSIEQVGEVGKSALEYGLVDLLFFGGGKLLKPIKTVGGMRTAAATAAEKEGVVVSGDKVVEGVKAWAKNVPASAQDQAQAFVEEAEQKFAGRILSITQGLIDKARSYDIGYLLTREARGIAAEGEREVAGAIRSQLPKTVQRYDKILSILYGGQKFVKRALSPTTIGLGGIYTAARKILK